MATDGNRVVEREGGEKRSPQGKRFILFPGWYDSDGRFDLAPSSNKSGLDKLSVQFLDAHVSCVFGFHREQGSHQLMAPPAIAHAVHRLFEKAKSKTGQMQIYLPFNNNVFTGITANGYLEHLKWRNLSGETRGYNSREQKCPYGEKRLHFRFEIIPFPR